MLKIQDVLTDYTVGEQLGKGARSVIHEVKRNSDGQVFAAKYVAVRGKSDLNVVAHLENEYRVLSRLHEDQNVPKQIVCPEDFRRVRKFFSLKGACLVMERVEGQSLAQFSDYSLPQAIRLFQDVCLALSYIHSRGLVHADMKPQNILVGDELRVKLIDFGFAAPIGSKLRGLKGTWGYLAPEQAGGELDVRTDVFNLGAVMFWVFTGENIPTIIPNDRSSGGYVPSAPFRMKAPVHFNSDMPMEISDLIVLCCKRDPLKRPTMQWVRQRLANVALRHELKLNEQPEP